MFRLILSALIGYILGKERKQHDKEGGSRTLAIVSLASCLVALISLEIATKIQPEIMNFTRMMSYCIVGIGFLGSSVIVQTKNKIDGLTSASLIWISVPISFCIGLGFYFYGIISAVIVYLILESKYWLIKIRKEDE